MRHAKCSRDTVVQCQEGRRRSEPGSAGQTTVDRSARTWLARPSRWVGPGRRPTPRGRPACRTAPLGAEGRRSWRRRPSSPNHGASPCTLPQPLIRPSPHTAHRLPAAGRHRRPRRHLDSLFGRLRFDHHPGGPAAWSRRPRAFEQSLDLAVVVVGDERIVDGPTELALEDDRSAIARIEPAGLVSATVQPVA